MPQISSTVDHATLFTAPLADCGANGGRELPRHVPGPGRDIEHEVVARERQPLEQPLGVGGEQAVEARILERCRLLGERPLDPLGMSVPHAASVSSHVA